MHLSWGVCAVAELLVRTNAIEGGYHGARQTSMLRALHARDTFSQGERGMRAEAGTMTTSCVGARTHRRRVSPWIQGGLHGERMCAGGRLWGGTPVCQACSAVRHARVEPGCTLPTV